jgi:putative endonuclease
MSLRSNRGSLCGIKICSKSHDRSLLAGLLSFIVNIGLKCISILDLFMSVKQPCIYIMASAKNGTLYTGVTSDLIKRVWQHKENLLEGFTKKYHVHQLVYYELANDMVVAIAREKQIKAGSRAKKLH